MDIDESDSIFGGIPHGAPSEYLRYGDPNIFDVIKTIERQGNLSRAQQMEMAQQLVGSAVKSPNLRWGTILGGLAGGATGGLGAKYLTNLSPEYQAGAGGAGALIGALIGRAIQKVQQKQGSVKDAARGDMTRKLVGQASSPLSGLRVAQKETPAYTAGFIKHLLELYPEVLSSRTTQTLADPAAVLAHKVRSLKSQLKAAPAKRNWLENLNLSSMLAS